MEGPVSEVSLLSITQATRATFPDLYFGLTVLIFIQIGSKRVLCPHKGELAGEAGDVLIFPPGSLVTLENRPIPNQPYRADGVCFSHDLVDAVFADMGPHDEQPGIQLLRAKPHQPGRVLALIKETLADETLPPVIRRHRLLEPLLWLRHHGVHLPVQGEKQPLACVRRLIEVDLSHPWRTAEVAAHFAMSEATFRRWLTPSGHGFSRILLNSRLERGLTLLQTTDRPISAIALDCGFKTPSHFSDSFKKRFGIKPRCIRSAEN